MIIDPKQPLFTRRRLIILFALVLLIYVVLWGSLFAWFRFSHNRSIDKARKAEQAYWDALQPEEKAIKKAESYLKASLTQVKPVHRVFLAYLQRTYGLDGSLALRDFTISQDPRTYPEEIHYLERIARPNMLVNQLPKTPFEGPSLTNALSANCDRLNLPGNFWQTMEQNYNAGGYYLTHNGFAFALLKDNGCTVPANQRSLESRTVDGMVRIIENPASNADLRYEAIAFVQLLGQKDKIKPEWIQQITEEQQADGSWDNPTSATDNDHTTILAIWALLGYTQPNINEPFIRK